MLPSSTQTQNEILDIEKGYVDLQKSCDLLKTENESLKKELKSKDVKMDTLNHENNLFLEPVNKEVEKYIYGLPENEKGKNSRPYNDLQGHSEKSETQKPIFSSPQQLLIRH